MHPSLGFTVVAQKHKGCEGTIEVMRSAEDNKPILVCSKCGLYWFELKSTAKIIQDRTII